MPIPMTARVPVDFTPPALTARIARENAEALKADRPQKPLPKIVVRVPTMYERDSFAAALVRGGVVHYSRTQIRDLMLAGVTHLMPEDRFDEVRADLEELWQAADAIKECETQRHLRYIELMEQQEQLPAARKMTPAYMNAELEKIQPQVQISDSKRVRTTAMQQDITSRYAPLQMAFADLAEQDVRRRWLCVEIYVINWRDLSCTPDGNGKGGVTRLEAEWLRSEIGGDAFDELADFIFAMHSIDGDEEKNLASLIESSSAPTGSQAAQETMSDQASDAGNSTAGDSTAIPATGSRKTTAPSRGSTKPAAKKTARSKPIPTAVP